MGCLGAILGGALLVLATLVPGAAAARSLLTRADLVHGHDPAPVPLVAFVPDTTAAPPGHRFEGSLRLRGGVHSRVVSRDPAFMTAADVALARTFPQDFDYEFVQDGAALIPVRRGALPGSHPWWEFILEPGRVWDEPGDGGYTRAVVPLSLEEKNANCTHHGLLTFLFRDGEVTQAVFQVSGETCRYLHLDLWGALEAHYDAHPVASREAVVAAYRAEVAARLPTAPEAQLAHDYPALDIAHLSLGAAAGRTLHGIVVDGKHYVSDCPTRAGDYPYCEVLDLPSYSTAKSVVGALALMRLQALTQAAKDQPVRDWVKAAACQGPAWHGVSFADLLDMATGNYASALFEADEDAPSTEGLFLPLDHAHKLAFACGFYPHRVAPGALWVYHTSDTYLLGSALQAYFRSLPGRSGQDFYRDLLVAEIFRPLRLSPVLAVTRRTYDAAAQPFTGWGLVYHRDDVARLARFVLLEHGRVRGAAVLDPAMLRRALQQDPGARGLPVEGLAGFRYQYGFWARNVQNLLGCGHEVWVPFMSGFGGISVVLFPNGVIYYNFADDGQVSSFDWGPVAGEAQKLKNMCGGS